MVFPPYPAAINEPFKSNRGLTAASVIELSLRRGMKEVIQFSVKSPWYDEPIAYSPLLSIRGLHGYTFSLPSYVAISAVRMSLSSYDGFQHVSFASMKVPYLYNRFPYSVIVFPHASDLARSLLRLRTRVRR
jgi:hypothetical protein